ncbi:MAG: nucleoside diphosphate kinase regulator [Bauldia sp.]
MNPLIDLNLSPEIVLGRDEHQRLLVLALGGTGHSADDSDFLLHELDRAMIVPPHTLPASVVRMGSRVRYRSNGGAERTVTLVYPKEADIGAGRISILTPVGTALLGLRRGQTISYRSRDGRRQTLTVLHVAGPSDDDPAAAA